MRSSRLLELLSKFLEGLLQSIDLSSEGGDFFFQLFDPLGVGSAARGSLRAPSGLGLIIERPILDLLGITKDTSLEVKTDGEALIIRPVKLGKKERLRESTKHDETLRKLAK